MIKKVVTHHIECVCCKLTQLTEPDADDPAIMITSTRVLASRFHKAPMILPTPPK